MADVSPKGNPTLNVYIDATTTGGVFNLVRDTPTAGLVVLEIDENGKFREPNPIVLHRSTGVAFTTGSIVEFYAGTGAGTQYASLERGGSFPPYFYVHFKTAVAADRMRIEGKTVQLLTPDQTGTIAELWASSTRHAEFTTGSGRFSLYFDPTGTGDSFVLKRGSSGIEALEVDSSHNFKFKDTSGTTRLTIAAGASGGEFTLGDASGSRGVVTVGRDTSGSPRCGVVKLTGQGGTVLYLWFRDSGGTYELKGSRTDPTTNDDPASGDTTIATFT